MGTTRTIFLRLLAQGVVKKINVRGREFLGVPRLNVKRKAKTAKNAKKTPNVQKVRRKTAFLRTDTRHTSNTTQENHIFSENPAKKSKNSDSDRIPQTSAQKMLSDPR